MKNAKTALLAALFFLSFCATASAFWGTWPASRWSSILFRPLGGTSGVEVAETADESRKRPAWAECFLAALERRVTLDLRGASLREACAILADSLGVTVIVSNEAAERARRFDLSVSAMRAVLALNWICRLAGAEWVLEDEAIFVRPRRAESAEDEKSPAERVAEFLEKESYSPPDFPAPDVPFER